MKNLKLLFLTILVTVSLSVAALGARPPVLDESKIQMSIAATPKSPPALVFTYPVAELREFAGLKTLNLQVLSFAGVSNAAVGGFALSAKGRLASNATWTLGFGGNWSSGQKFKPAVLLGVTVLRI